MIDTIFDFALDHSAEFGGMLVATVIAAAATVAWAYGRFHERATRRRSARVIS